MIFMMLMKMQSWKLSLPFFFLTNVHHYHCLEAGLTVSGISITLGDINIFNVYPDEQDPALTESGGLWDPVQIGFTGAFIYGRLRFSIE